MSLGVSEEIHEMNRAMGGENGEGGEDGEGRKGRGGEERSNFYVRIRPMIHELKLRFIHGSPLFM